MKWLYLEIDVPVCKDFILHEEQKTGIVMTHEEAVRLRHKGIQL